MALKYQPTKHAWFPEGESMTEQEFKDSCDINKMIKAVHRGHQIRGMQTAPWIDGAEDDTTMDAVSYRIKKENLERELHEIAQSHEFSEEELNSMKLSPDAKKKFGFKTRKKASTDLGEKNDDKTTKKTPTDPNDAKTPEPKS